MKPKEGTILTVAKGAADKALDLAHETEDLVYFCDEVIKHAEYKSDSGNASGLKAGRGSGFRRTGTGSGVKGSL